MIYFGILVTLLALLTAGSLYCVTTALAGARLGRDRDVAPTAKGGTEPEGGHHSGSDASIPRRRPVRIFISHAMTASPDEEVAQLNAVVGSVMEALSQHEVEVVAPKLAEPTGTAPLTVAATAYRLLMESDGVIAVDWRPNTAAGVALVAARSAGAPTLVLSSDATSSPASLSNLRDVQREVVYAPKEVTGIVRDWLHHMHTELERRRDIRTSVWENVAREVSALETDVLSIPDTVLDEARLSRSRLIALLSHPSVLASAPFSEVAALYRALGRSSLFHESLLREDARAATPPISQSASGWAGRALTPQQWSALVQAALEGHWNDAELGVLVERFFEHGSHEAPSDFGTTSAWMALHRIAFVTHGSGGAVPS